MGAVSHDLHIDALLSEMAQGYRPEGFIGDMIFPMVTVSKQSDLYAIFSRADRTRQQDTKRSPGTRAKRVEENVSSATYFASNYALSGMITVEDRANADPIYVSELLDGKVRYIMDHLMLDMDIRIANQVTNTSNVGSSSAVSSGWGGAGDPLGDINAAIDNVHYSTGKRPTDIALGIEAWNSFRRDANVRDLIFGNNNGGGYPNVSQVAQLLDVDRIQIGGAFKNTNDEGLSESLASVWGDNVLVYHRPATPSREMPSFGYAFRWAGAGLPNMQVERHGFDTRIKAEEVEVGYYQDEVITGDDYGFLLTAVNSST